MNNIEIGNAIEKRVGEISATKAHVSTSIAELTRKGGDLFFLYVNEHLPLDHKPERVLEAKSHGEVLFSQYLTLVEKTASRAPGLYERSVVQNPQPILDGFIPFVERTPVGAKARELGRKRLDALGKQFNDLPADQRSALAMALQEQHQEKQKAEQEILAELDRDLADIEARPSKKRGKK